MRYTNEKQIADVICTHLDERNIRYQYRRMEDLIACGFAMSNKLRMVHFETHISGDGYNTYAVLPICADPEDPKMMGSVLAYANLVNYRLRDGNFEVDPHDGEIRFRYFMSCENVDELTDRVIHISIATPLQMFEYYGEGFVQIIYCDKSAEEALSYCLAAMEANENSPAPEEDDDEDHIPSFDTEDDENVGKIDDLFAYFRDKKCPNAEFFDDDDDDEFEEDDTIDQAES